MTTREALELHKDHMVKWGDSVYCPNNGESKEKNISNSMETRLCSGFLGAIAKIMFSITRALTVEVLRIDLDMILVSMQASTGEVV